MGGVHEKNSDLIFIRMTIDQLTIDLFEETYLERRELKEKKNMLSF